MARRAEDLDRPGPDARWAAVAASGGVAGDSLLPWRRGPRSAVLTAADPARGRPAGDDEWAGSARPRERHPWRGRPALAPVWLLPGAQPRSGLGRAGCGPCFPVQHLEKLGRPSPMAIKIVQLGWYHGQGVGFRKPAWWRSRPGCLNFGVRVHVGRGC